MRTATGFRALAGLCLLGAAVGCGGPSPPAGTGAREAAEAYYDALLRRDWSAAYDRLHPESRARWGLARFTKLAEQVRGNVGFEPERVRVRSCEERGDEAVAHVVWLGRGRYEDGVTLRRTDGGWGVVLPQNFGHRRTR